MLKKYIASRLLDNLVFQPTKSQEELIDMLSSFLESQEERKIMLIKGYAGTGKTTVVNAIVKTLKENSLRSVLLAPTGRAAKVMSSYSKVPAFTIHKKIYRQKSGSDGLGVFVLDKNMHKNTTFIVDEASMIGQSTAGSAFGSGDLLSDLIQYVEDGTNCRLIFVGDTAQLPPVGLDVSPALNAKVLAGFFYDVHEYTLTDVVRQAEDSGVLYNATKLRYNIAMEQTEIPRLELAPYTDIKKIGGADLIELINDSYDTYGELDTIVVTRSNKRANRFNAGIRSQILWKEEQISKGDLLMVVKNNYFWKDEDEKLDFIANGDIARIERIIGYEEIYGLHFADVELALTDYDDLFVEARIMLDVLEVEGPALPVERQRQLYDAIIEDYPELTTKKKRSDYLAKDRNFNALQVKFAYAVTCHKSQGGQWKSVFVDQGYFVEDMMSIDYLRWLYTAFTRASENLYLVNFDDKFFDEP